MSKSRGFVALLVLLSFEAAVACRVSTGGEDDEESERDDDRDEDEEEGEDASSEERSPDASADAPSEDEPSVRDDASSGDGPGEDASQPAPDGDDAEDASPPDAPDPPAIGYTPPEGVPADFCTPFAECCYLTQDAEICDGLLTSYYQSQAFIPEEDLNEICNAECSELKCQESDELTGETLRNAKSQLAGGSNLVRVSKFGCQTYERTVEDDLVVSELLSSGDGEDEASFEVEFSPEQAMFSTSTAGYLTWSADATADADGELEQVIVEQSSATSGQMFRRDTYTPVDEETLHVVSEVSSQGSSLFESGEYEVPEAMPFGGLPSVDVVTEGCSDSQRAELLSTLESVIVDGFKCMRDLGRSDIGSFLLRTYFGNTITLSCAPGTAGTVAQVAITGKFTSQFFGFFGVEVNSGEFFGENADGSRKHSPEQLKNVLLHELLHLRFGPHQPSIGGDRQFEIDPTYACASMCFEANAAHRTKCACATCLDTNVCDDRCQGFSDCDPNMGASCNAVPPQWFASATECATTCTAPCKVHDVDCDPCN